MSSEIPHSFTKTSSEYDQDYYQRGIETGKSLYSNYRWMPSLTIPLASTLCEQLPISEEQSVLDFGCAFGFLVRALRLLHRNAWGYDISEYALGQAPKDVAPYCRGPHPDFMKPGNGLVRWDWILCKDVLEHLEEKDLPTLLYALRGITNHIWAAIPLGEEVEDSTQQPGTLFRRYIIPAYDLDVTHKIRRPRSWWMDRFKDAGFHYTSARYLMPHVKENWAHHDKGNLFITCA